MEHTGDMVLDGIKAFFVSLAPAHIIFFIAQFAFISVFLPTFFLVASYFRDKNKFCSACAMVSKIYDQSRRRKCSL